MAELADLHIHSCYSTNWLWGQSCIVTPKEIIESALKKGLRAIAITDHDSIRGGQIGLSLSKDKNIIVIPGIEVSTKYGHIIGLCVNESIPKKISPEETIELIHDQGGIAIAAHPTYWYAALRRRVRNLKLDALEGFNARCAISNNRAQKLANELNLPTTGGSDAHSAPEVGNGITEFKQIYSAEDIMRSIKKHETKVYGFPAKLFIQVLPASLITLYSKLDRRYAVNIK